jgi:hypothetical protein
MGVSMPASRINDRMMNTPAGNSISLVGRNLGIGCCRYLPSWMAATSLQQTASRYYLPTVRGRGLWSQKTDIGNQEGFLPAVSSGRRFDRQPKPTAGCYLIYTSRPETHFHAQSVTFPG